MYLFAVFAIAVSLFIGLSGNQAYGGLTDEASVVLVETGKSGTGKETDAGRGAMGKKSPFGSDQPASGDFSPNPSDATRSGSKPQDVDKTIAGSEQPSGIGEKGSGQTKSTTERSGGPQPSASESMSKSAAEHGEGKTEKAMKDLQSQKPKNK
jgi:hypothetical protein